MINKILFITVFATAVAVSPRLFGQDNPAAAALAAESTTYCASTLNTNRPTPPSAIIDKVNEACALLQKEGPAAFPKFCGKGSPFIYEGTYVAVQGLADGKMLVHPILYKMVGQNLMSLKDSKGKRNTAVMADLCREKGEGWVEYYWPKPGTDTIVRKITFVKKCTMSDGTDVMVISGLYNYSDADVAKLDLH